MAARCLKDICTRPGRALKIGLGILPLVLLGNAEVRLTVRVIVHASCTLVSSAAYAFLLLLRIDGVDTARTVALEFARIGLAVLPSLLVIRSAPPCRRLWLIPLVGMLVMVSSVVSLAACASVDRWLLLAALSVTTAFLTKSRFFRWTAVLPFMVLWEVVPSHGTFFFSQVGTDQPAYRDKLLAECAHREGARPLNLTADLLMPYHGINVWGDDLVLLTGEGPYDGGMRGHTGGRPTGSWWMRRKSGGYAFEAPSRATGNLWHGCQLGGAIWMSRANHIVGARRVPEGGPTHEEVYHVSLPAQDIDFGEIACGAERDRLYVGEATGGGLWEVARDGSKPRRHHIGGIVLLPKRRVDGRIVMTNTSSLIVFDPQEERVIERMESGLFNSGFDVCEADGRVAVADLFGRLRVFETDATGHYNFAWGVSLFAPRRVAFSPDCARIAVTSADDHRVFIIDAATHRVVRTFQAGPALREVAATGPREFSVTDVCSMTTYRW